MRMNIKNRKSHHNQNKIKGLSMDGNRRYIFEKNLAHYSICLIFSFTNIKTYTDYDKMVETCKNSWAKMLLRIYEDGFIINRSQLFDNRDYLTTFIIPNFEDNENKDNKQTTLYNLEPSVYETKPTPIEECNFIIKAEEIESKSREILLKKKALRCYAPIKQHKIEKTKPKKRKPRRKAIKETIKEPSLEEIKDLKDRIQKQQQYLLSLQKEATELPFYWTTLWKVFSNLEMAKHQEKLELSEYNIIKDFKNKNAYYLSLLKDISLVLDALK
jgi:hypothetical protein